MSVLDLFREKGYACGYLTTNGTIITEERAEALADLAASGFLKHISVSIDGPGEIHDVGARPEGHVRPDLRGAPTAAGRGARKGAPLRVSINTTVAHESLDALDQMVDVAEELGVDAIGLNHLMFSTPEEVAETVRLIGAKDAVGHRDVRDRRPGARHRDACARRSPRSRRSAGRRTSCSTSGRRCTRSSSRTTTRPARQLEGRCLYPFLHARVSFSGQGVLLPVHPRRGRRPRELDARGDLER